MLKFIIQHPTFGRTYAKCVMSKDMANLFINKPMQGGTCVGVWDMDKPIPDNKCALHMDKYQAPRKQTHHENVCDMAVRFTSAPAFPPLPPVHVPKVKRGWKKCHGAAVMHGETPRVLTRRERFARMVKLYVPPKPVVRVEPGSWFPRPISVCSVPAYVPEDWRAKDIKHYRTMWHEARERYPILALEYLTELLKLELDEKFWLTFSVNFYD